MMSERAIVTEALKASVLFHATTNPKTPLAFQVFRAWAVYVEHGPSCEMTTEEIGGPNWYIGRPNLGRVGKGITQQAYDAAEQRALDRRAKELQKLSVLEWLGLTARYGADGWRLPTKVSTTV